MIRRYQVWIGSCLAAGLVSALASGCIGDSRAQDPWTGWTTLRMQAKAGVLFSGKIEMHNTVSSGKRSFVTQTTARFLGARVAHTVTETTIDTETGRTEMYTSRTKKRGRRYTFGERACVVERLAPINGPDAPLEQWEVTSTQRFTYPEDDEGNTVEVFDYYGMLLHLRETGLNEEGDEVTLHVATSNGVTGYRIVVSEVRETERTIEDLKRMEKRVFPLRELRLRILPVDPESAGEGFLKMEGETELWVEAGSKTLLNISGKAPKVPGRIKIVLAGFG